MHLRIAGHAIDASICRARPAVRLRGAPRGPDADLRRISIENGSRSRLGTPTDRRSTRRSDNVCCESCACVSPISGLRNGAALCRATPRSRKIMSGRTDRPTQSDAAVASEEPARRSISTATFRPSSPSSPTSCRTARPRSISGISASTSRNGGSCRCSAIEPGIPASRICHVIGLRQGPVQPHAVDAAETRPGHASGPTPDDGRTHLDFADREGTRRPMTSVIVARARTRATIAVLPEARTKREVLIDLLRARPRQSRCGEGARAKARELARRRRPHRSPRTREATSCHPPLLPNTDTSLHDPAANLLL